MIFDGRAFAKEIETQVGHKVAKLVMKPKIVSVLVGNDPESALYTRLKEKAASRVGIEFEVARIESEKLQVESLSSEIGRIAAREDVTGVMIQLPIKGLGGEELKKLLRQIPFEKDVDGLSWEESGVMPATVRAVLSIFDKIGIDNKIEMNKKKVVVLGAGGAVGTPLVHFLRQRGVEVYEVERNTPDPVEIVRQGEVVISCVGKAGLVTGDMVQEGVIAIDVGMSSVVIESQNPGEPAIKRVVGDMTQEVYQKASIAVPVPGGVGPVTIASLMVNGARVGNGGS